MTFSGRFVISVLGAFAAITITTELQAQACLGLPQRSSIAYESAEYAVGKSSGVVAALAGRRTAFDVAFRSRDVQPGISGFEGGGRFSIIIPISKFRFCPGLGATYTRDTWDVDSDLSVKASTLALRAGAGLGIEQPVYKGLSLIPFVGVYYQFAGMLFEIDAPDGENDTTGDTVSRAQVDYGLMARFKFVYGGLAATAYSDAGDRPVMARWIIGLTFPAGGGSGGSSRLQRSRSYKSERVRRPEP